MAVQIQQLYEQARSLGESEFVAAVELAIEQGAYGAEYIAALSGTQLPAVTATTALTVTVRNQPEQTAPSPVNDEAQAALDWLAQLPAQSEISRELECYEDLVANRRQLALGVAAVVTNPALAQTQVATVVTSRAGEV